MIKVGYNTLTNANSTLLERLVFALGNTKLRAT